MLRRATILSVVIGGFALYTSSASADIVFSDNWNDQTVTGPVLTSGGDWVASGNYTASAANPGGHTNPLAGTLNPQPVANTSIQAYFGDNVAYTPITVTYDIRQADIQTSNTQFSTFLIDSVTSKNLQFIAIANPYALGTIGGFTGFGIRYDGGSLLAGIVNTVPTYTDDDFHTVKLVFSPNANPNLSEVNAYYDNVLVGSWGVPSGITRADTVRLHSSADISYNIDNFSIDATVIPVPEPASAAFLAVASVVGLAGRRR